MHIRQMLTVTFLFFLLACSAKKTPPIVNSYKDTVVKQYLDYTSATDFYDTANYNYKVLKAHYYNDTVFLKQVLSDLELSKKGTNNEIPDSIRRHSDIRKMQVDEVFQLNYTESFCDLDYFLTLSRKGDSVKLRTVIYQKILGSTTTNVFSESEKKLTIGDWNEFEGTINFADFWSLSPFKEAIGFDGDYLTIEAIERNRFDHKVIKQHRVSRRFVSNTALFSAYSLLARFAAIKKDCGK